MNDKRRIVVLSRHPEGPTKDDSVEFVHRDLWGVDEAPPGVIR